MTRKELNECINDGDEKGIVVCLDDIENRVNEVKNLLENDDDLPAILEAKKVIEKLAEDLY